MKNKKKGNKAYNNNKKIKPQKENKKRRNEQRITKTIGKGLKCL